MSSSDERLSAGSKGFVFTALPDLLFRPNVGSMSSNSIPSPRRWATVRLPSSSAMWLSFQRPWRYNPPIRQAAAWIVDPQRASGRETRRVDPRPITRLRNWKAPVARHFEPALDRVLYVRQCLAWRIAVRRARPGIRHVGDPAIVLAGPEQ